MSVREAPQIVRQKSMPSKWWKTLMTENILEIPH